MLERELLLLLDDRRNANRRKEKEKGKRKKWERRNLDFSNSLEIG